MTKTREATRLVEPVAGLIRRLRCLRSSKGAPAPGAQADGARRGRLTLPETTGVCWRGASGWPYSYEIFDITAPPRCDRPANFIYARREADRTWSALYVGATTSLEQQFAGGRSQPFIAEHGVTHVHVHTSPPDARLRAFEARDLVAYWQPPGNPTFDCRGHSS